MKKKIVIFNLAAAALLLAGCNGNTPASSASSASSPAASSASSEVSQESAPSSEATSSSSQEQSEVSSESSTEEMAKSTVEEAKKAATGTCVCIEATLLAKGTYGFYVQDNSGTIFVYTGGSADLDMSAIALGSKIKVTGYASVHNMSHQISSLKNDDDSIEQVTVEVLEAGSGEISIDYQAKSLGDVSDEDNENVSFYGTPISLRGYVTYNGDYNNPYCLTDENDAKVLLSRNTFNDIDVSEDFAKLVEVKGFVYCYASNTFSVTINEVRELTEGDVDDSTAVDAALHYVCETLDGTKTSKDITFVTSYLGANIFYESANPDVIDSAGTYYEPEDGNTDVTFTVTADRGGSSGEVEITITALFVGNPKVVISESFTAGGNSGAAYNCDFVELYNQTDEDVDLSSYSLQNCATGSTSKFAVHALSGTIKAHDYFLIRGKVKDVEGQTAIEAYDLAVDDFDPGAKDYILALANDQKQITFDYDGSGDTGSTLTSTNVVDLLGAGKATLYEGEKVSISSNAKSLQRTDPTVDTDNNKADFKVDTPTPTKSVNAQE